MKRKPIKRKKNSKKEKSKDVVFMKHPFNDVPKDELFEALVEKGKEAKKSFEGEKKMLIELFQNYDPLMILTTLATHGLTVPISKEGIPKASENKPSQNHVELAQAIVLSVDKSKISMTPIPPEQLQKIWDGLISISDNFMASRYVHLAEKKTSEEKAITLVCEQVRAHTQFIRNWGYFKKVISVLHELYGSLDSLYESAVGVKATTIVNIFYWMTTEVERRHRVFYQKMSFCFSGKDAHEIIDRYNKSFNLEDSTQKMLNFVEEHGIPKQGIISMLLSHSDFRRSNELIFSIKEIAQKFKLEVSNVKRLMDLLSLQLGSLQDQKFEYLFLDNPVCKKPLIKLSDEDYFCAMPQLFFSFSLPILDNCLKSSKENAEKLSKRKAIFLEKRIATMFKDSFPSSVVQEGFEWKLDMVKYETDLIVKYDNQLIIIEAKSGSISDIALRGAIKRIKKHLKEVIYGSAIQAKRLENLILNIKSGGIDKERYELKFPFDLKEIQFVTSIAVTLEDFATIQANTEALPTKELFGEKLPSVPTMLHSDLEVIFDILKSPTERLHYLKRRSQILKTVKYTGNELDLLGLYISNGFCLSDFEDGKTQLILNDMSTPVDEYYTAIEHEYSIHKPKRKITKWFQDMVDYLEERQPKGFSQIVFNLLCVPYEDQKKLENEAKKIHQKLKRQKKFQKDQIDRILYSPPVPLEVGVAVVFSFSQEMDQRHKKMEETSGQFFDQSKIDFCTVILRDVEGMHYPYASLAFSSRHPQS